MGEKRVCPSRIELGRESPGGTSVFNTHRRTIASVLAIPLALGAVAIVRAAATGGAVPAARAGAADQSAGGASSPSSGAAGNLSHLFPVTPDGTG